MFFGEMEEFWEKVFDIFVFIFRLIVILIFLRLLMIIFDIKVFVPVIDPFIDWSIRNATWLLARFGIRF